MNTLGERLNYLRKTLLKMTLERFGERLGVKKSTLSAIENNQRELSNQLQHSICREFNVNRDWLLEGKGEPFVELTKGEEIADFVNKLKSYDNSFKAKLITILTQMDAEEMALLEKMVKKIAGIVDTDTKKETPLEEMSTSQLEDIYKKEVLSSASDNTQSASSITDGTGA
jgi:transcriptional regulator with XRE-family HTH domain